MSTAGHCLCGRLTYTAEGDPAWITYCHCASCRRHSGSPVTAFVNYPLERVTFRGERTTYASSPGVTRSFCARCGTPIGYENQRRAGEIDLYLGTLDDPAAFPPESHTFHGEHLPWFETTDHLPRRE